MHATKEETLSAVVRHRDGSYHRIKARVLIKTDQDAILRMIQIAYASVSGRKTDGPITVEIVELLSDEPIDED